MTNMLGLKRRSYVFLWLVTLRGIPSGKNLYVPMTDFNALCQILKPHDKKQITPQKLIVMITIYLIGGLHIYKSALVIYFWPGCQLVFDI